MAVQLHEVTPNKIRNEFVWQALFTLLFHISLVPSHAFRNTDTT